MHCVKCGIPGLTNAKLGALDWEYGGFQWWMQFGVDPGILAQHKSAKGYKYKKDVIRYKDYPVVIPHTSVWYRQRSTKLTPHWIKVSVRKRKGVGVWLPIKPHKLLPDFVYLRDSLLLMNKRGYYELRLIFDVPQRRLVPEHMLAVDLGERVIATVCDSVGNKLFLGRMVRGIRGHFAWLRRQLGRRKLLKKIKMVGRREHNVVNNELHLVANAIIALAKQHQSAIVLGNLKGVRRRIRSKRLNRILSHMPFYKLTSIIRYKAEQQGLPVYTISEHNTSQTCHRCGNQDKSQRKSQGLFICSSCGLQYNADLNGALNILTRAKDQGFLARALAEAQKPAAVC